MRCQDHVAHGTSWLYHSVSVPTGYKQYLAPLKITHQGFMQDFLVGGGGRSLWGTAAMCVGVREYAAHTL